MIYIKVKQKRLFHCLRRVNSTNISDKVQEGLVHVPPEPQELSKVHAVCVLSAGNMTVH